LLVVPSNAFAQRDAFYSTLLGFYKTLGGVYGDEGPQLVAQVVAISTALQRWDEEIRAAESQLRPQLNGRDRQTELQVHTLLAALYMERGRYADALRRTFALSIPAPRLTGTRALFIRLRGDPPKPRTHSALPGSSTLPIPRTRIDSWSSSLLRRRHRRTNAHSRRWHVSNAM
jgi:hypothetical protein